MQPRKARMRGFCQWTRSSAQSVTVTPSGRVIWWFPTWIICLGLVGRCDFIAIPGRPLRPDRGDRGHASAAEWPAVEPQARSAAAPSSGLTAAAQRRIESYPQAHPEDSVARVGKCGLRASLSWSPRPLPPAMTQRTDPARSLACQEIWYFLDCWSHRLQLGSVY